MSDLLEQNPNRKDNNLETKRRIKKRKVVSLIAMVALIAYGGKYSLQYMKEKKEDKISNNNVNSLLKVQEEEEKARVERVNNSKVAYLTFDDGPNYNTNEILDILKENNIKATFFLVGSMVKNNPNIVERINEEGHVIANHTYSHKYNYKTKEEFIAEVEATDRLISEAIGEDYKSYFVRVPGGSMGKSMIQEAIKENAYKSINWTAKFGDDEKGGKVNVDYVINRVKETAGDDKYEVILAHSTKSVTAKALQTIIDNLKVDGYIFEPLMEDSPVSFN